MTYSMVTLWGIVNSILTKIFFRTTYDILNEVQRIYVFDADSNI